MTNQERKYHWRDEDVVIIVDRAFLEEDIVNYERKTLHRNGKLTDSVYEQLNQEIKDGLFFFLQDCYTAVEDRIKRERRSKGASKRNLHFRVYWRSVPIYGEKFKQIKTYASLDDALNFIRDGIYCSVDDEFQIFEVKNGVECSTNLVPAKSTNYAF